MMTTRAQAQTVLGTPYYISPEMVSFHPKFLQTKNYKALGITFQQSTIAFIECICCKLPCPLKLCAHTSLLFHESTLRPVFHAFFLCDCQFGGLSTISL